MRLARFVPFAALAVAACAGAPTSARPAGLRILDRLPTGDQSADRAALDSAYRVVRSLAAGGTCADGSCAALPVGAKACGGPSSYVSYCPTSPDAARLRAAADEVTRAERAFNERYGVMSTCEVTAPPANCRVDP